MESKVEIVDDWNDDLIWCPSQCYLYLEFENRQWVLYLRWRHTNPWTAELVECIKDNCFDMHDLDNWVNLDIYFFKDSDDLEKLKEHSFELAKKKLYQRGI